MANSRLAQILEQEYKTKGIVGGAVSALGKRTKEKIDIRNSLFSGSGLGSTIGTKIFGKGYSATRKTNSSTSPSSPSLDGISNATLEDINTNTKIAAKNSLSLPMMARDMNLLKLNSFKMVKLLGGQANVNKTDMFFTNARKREEEYERQFGKKPQQLKTDGTKKESGEGGFLSSILGFFKGGIGNIIETLIGALIKGGLVAGLLVGIGKYFSDPEFREKVNVMALKLFETIDSVLKTIFGEDYKQDLLIGAAVVSGVVVTLGAALLGLQAAIIAATAAIGKAVLGGGVPGAGLPDTPDSDKNKGKTDKKGRRIPQRDPKTGRFMKAAPPSGGKFGGRAAGVLGGLMVLEAATGGALSSIINYDDDRVWAISSDFEKTPYFDNITDDEMGQFLEFLEKEKYDEASNYYKSLGPKYGYTQKNKGGVSGFFGATEWVKSPTPSAVPSSSSSVGPSPTTTTNNNDTQSNSGSGTTPTRNNNDNYRNQIEAYLGKAISDREYDALLKAVGAEAGPNPMERAAVAAVILNRAKKLGGTGADIIRALNAPFQFQAITGPDGKSGTVDNPWSKNAQKLIPGIEKQIADNIALVPKGIDSFTSAVPGAYKDVGGQSKFEQKMAEMKSLGGQQIGQSVFAGGGVSVAQAGGTGSARTQLASSQASVNAVAAAAVDKPLFSPEDLAGFAAAMKAPGMQNGGGGMTQAAFVSKATPYDRDFYHNLLKTVAL